MKALITLIAVFLLACSHQQSNAPQPSKEQQETVLIKKEQKDSAYSNFSNPVFFAGTGTSFFEFFSMLKQTQPGNIDTLLFFVRQTSIKKHGRENIRKMLETKNINFSKKLKACKKMNDTAYVMNYIGRIVATSTIKTVTVSIENDTCKLVLPANLKDFLK